MHRVVSLLLGALLTLSLASSVQAGTLSIDFDFSQSSVSILGGVIAVPPDGSISASTAAHVSVVADGLATPVAGIATLQSLGVTADIDTNILGKALVEGAVSANQVDTAIGSLLLTGSTGNAYFPDFMLAVNADVGCIGSGCLSIGLPILSASTQSLAALLPIAGIATPGAATINTQFSVTVGGISALVTLVGSEISRHYVPEPNSFALLGGGLVVLVAVGRTRMRRAAAARRA